MLNEADQLVTELIDRSRVFVESIHKDKKRYIVLRREGIYALNNIRYVTLARELPDEVVHNGISYAMRYSRGPLEERWEATSISFGQGAKNVGFSYT